MLWGEIEAIWIGTILDYADRIELLQEKGSTIDLNGRSISRLEYIARLN